MASLLIIEDGTGVADANSYATADEARDYAAARNVTLAAAPGSGNDPVEMFLILANDYLESLEYIGRKATTTQALKWPRLLYYCDPFYNPSAPTTPVLPVNVKNAQMQLVIEQSNGIDLFPSTPGGIGGQVVTRERVDVIETSYSERFGAPTTPTMPKVTAMLKDVTIATGLRSIRV